MSITDDIAQTMEATGLEGSKKGTPMDLGFTQSDARAEDGTFSVGADPDNDEDGTVDDIAPVADLFVTCIKDEIGGCAQGSLSPRREF